MSIKESGEMYLESIYTLSKTKPHLRSVDLAEYMGFSKPSVSRGIGLLKEQGLVKTEPDGFLTLTAEGLCMAMKIFERHTVLTEALVAMGVDRKTAADDACRMEHVISDETFDAIKRHLSKVDGKI